MVTYVHLRSLQARGPNAKARRRSNVSESLGHIHVVSEMLRTSFVSKVATKMYLLSRPKAFLSKRSIILYLPFFLTTRCLGETVQGRRAFQHYIYVNKLVLKPIMIK
jgi:hypothetical protein